MTTDLRASILAEAAEIAMHHPSKDAQAFACSVTDFLTSPVAPEQVVAALVCENCGLPSNEWASHPCTTTSAPESAATPAAPSAVTDDRAYRKAWAKYAAKQHSWLNNSFPPMRDGRFDCAEHESEFQIFLAGVRHGRS